MRIYVYQTGVCKVKQRNVMLRMLFGLLAVFVFVAYYDIYIYMYMSASFSFVDDGDRKPGWLRFACLVCSMFSQFFTFFAVFPTCGFVNVSCLSPLVVQTFVGLCFPETKDHVCEKR